MKLWQKIKQIKHWEIYVAVIVIVVMLVIYLSSLTPQRKSAPVSVVTTTDNNTTMNTTYAAMLESKLQKVLSSVAGAGKVAVLVMTDGEGSAELAYDEQAKTVTQTGTSGQEITTTTVDKQLVIQNGSPVVLWTNPPQLVGIVIVATGASNVAVRLNLLRAVQTILGERQVPIQILSGN